MYTQFVGTLLLINLLHLQSFLYSLYRVIIILLHQPNIAGICLNMNHQNRSCEIKIQPQKLLLIIYNIT